MICPKARQGKRIQLAHSPVPPLAEGVRVEANTFPSHGLADQLLWHHGARQEDPGDCGVTGGANSHTFNKCLCARMSCEDDFIA